MATIYYMATTLDGHLATTHHSLDWLIEVPVLGSSTYEWAVRHEQMMDEPHKWREWYADRPTGCPATATD